jgi:hypothetical protein
MFAVWYNKLGKKNGMDNIVPDLEIRRWDELKVYFERAKSLNR